MIFVRSKQSFWFLLRVPLFMVSDTGRYPLVVDLIVGTKRLTKVLMDGGSGLNILYVEMLDAMWIDQARVRPTGAPFHGFVPGK